MIESKLVSSHILPTNQWLAVPANWRPQLPVAPSIATSFLFHHIRPTTPISLAPEVRGRRNGLAAITPQQVSLIVGVDDDLFVCATVTSSHLDKFHHHYLASELQRFLDAGQAALWHLPFSNLLQGPYEAFNGPNPIDPS